MINVNNAHVFREETDVYSSMISNHSKYTFGFTLNRADKDGCFRSASGELYVQDGIGDKKEEIRKLIRKFSDELSAVLSED